MSLHPVFIFFLVVMVGLAIWTAQKTGDQMSKLQKQGFIISHDLNGNPRLVIDEAHEEIAIVHSKGAERLSFDQVESVKINFDQGTQADTNFRIEIRSAALAHELIAVGYENEWRAKQEFSKLQELLKP